MTLTRPEVELFYKLWYSLVWNINEVQGIVPRFPKPIFGHSVNEEPFRQIRKVLWENPQWIDEFLQGRAREELSDAECEMIASWRSHFVKDRFVVMKHLKKYSVLMTLENPVGLYGVCGLCQPLKELLHDEVPRMVNITLLPFQDKIIFDSFIDTYKMRFGKGARDDFKAAYDEAKETTGIIENMAVPPIPVKPPQKKPKTSPQNISVTDTKGANVPKAMSARYMQIAQIIEDFCLDKLNDEYCEVCLRALAKLCRKRPSPLTAGKALTWASGIVYAIGSCNFIFDKSQPVHMTAQEIGDWFGLAKSTAAGKAAEINKLLNLSYYNTEFMLPSMMANNSMIWYLEVNGYLVDIRHMPREVQEEAFDMGLIPYIPADRGE